MKLIAPNHIPPLDRDFRPAVLANHAFVTDAQDTGQAVPLILGLERANGNISRFETVVFPDGHPRAGENLDYAERLVKFLLWQRGGCHVYVGGPRAVGEHIQRIYAPDGARAFDHRFMGERAYQQPFRVTICEPAEVPPAHEQGKALGHNLDGYRIGFDLGASDLKVSAVVEGESVFSTEIEWNPVTQTDPNYHYEAVTSALDLAASKMPQLDAIGGSSAGIYVDNQAMVASLYRSIPPERFNEIRGMFLRIRDAFGVPLEIVNDGEVTALAGSMSLNDSGILGIAMGSSEAGGYTNMSGLITDWLNELAFCPVDYNPEAAVDEWSGDRGCGALYFSQQAVFRLAPKVGIDIPTDLTNAQKLKFVQTELEAGHAGAAQIWETIGIYLGYTVAHYADFYELKHVLILGRVTSGRGGPMILDKAQEVLAAEFPKLATRIQISLPDEKSRRVGQSIAAASLPKITPQSN